MFGKTKTNYNDVENIEVADTSSNRKKLLLIIGLVLVLVLIILALCWWWFSKKTDEKAQEAKAKAEAESGCGDITTEDGKYEGVGPYYPVVMAKISGNYPKEQEVCEWTVNGEDFGKSEPYGDYCIRYGLTFYHLGEYKVSYKVAGLKNCPKEKILKITSLTPEESARQKAAIQKLIDAGWSEEQLEAAKNHMLRKY